MKRLELLGYRFDRLTVIKEAGVKHGRSFWTCKCDCGNERDFNSSDLRAGDTKSCGCLNSDIVSFLKTTHGMKGTRLYNIWRGMKDRCTNKNCTAYRNYGERGIKFCERWNDFSLFMDDMIESYRDDLTLERKNVNGNYCKENCEWISKSKQSRNRRNSIWIETEQGIMTLNEAAKLANVSWFCMYNRYLRKCSKEKLLLPANKAGRSFTNVASAINR